MPNNAKKSKGTVVCFRVTEAQAAALQEMVDEHPIAGVTSGYQLARKVTLDYVANRLVYKKADDALVDLEAFGS